MDELRQQKADSAEEQARPPARPERLESVRYYEDGERIVLSRKAGGWFCYFILLWLVGLTIALYHNTSATLNDPTTENVGFTLLAAVGWLALTAFFLWVTVGVERLTITRDEVRYVYAVLVPFKRRRFPVGDVERVRFWRRHQEDRGAFRGIELVTVGEVLRFRAALSPAERRWLAHRLRHFLGKATGRTLPADEHMEAADTGDMLPSTQSEVLTLENTSATPPGERGGWRLVRERKAFSFEKRGRLDIGSCGCAFVIVLILNGFVGVSIAVLFGWLVLGAGAPQGGEWWALLLFLAPFVFMALLQSGRLLGIMTEPLRRTVWRFEKRRIVHETCWPLLVESRQHNIKRLSRLELRKADEVLEVGSEAEDSTNPLAGRLPPGAEMELVIVDSHNKVVFVIPKLTGADARWMGRVILEERAAWFGEGGGTEGSSVD